METRPEPEKPGARRRAVPGSETIGGNEGADGPATGLGDRFSADELAALLLGSSEWIWETDADLRFTWLSPNYRSVTGIPPEAILGRLRFDFLRHVLPEGSSVAAHLDDLHARRSFRDFVYAPEGAKPECRWISISGLARFGADGGFLGYRGIGRNVTPLAARIEELSAEQAPHPPTAGAPAREDGAPAPPSPTGALVADLRQMLEVVPIGMLVLDGNLNVEIANRAFFDLWQIDASAMASARSFRDLKNLGRHSHCAPLDDATWEEHVAERERWLREGSPEPLVMARPDGCTMISAVTRLGNGRRFVSYVDVTELKARERELARTLDMARLSAAVLDSVPEPVFVKDESLAFVMVNRAFAEVWGTVPENMIGKRSIAFARPAAAAAFEASERAVIETGEIFEAEQDIEIAGVTRSRIVRKNRVLLPGGKAYVAGFLFDVTEMRRREREAEEARHRLAEVIELMPAGVLIYDRDDRLVLANRPIQESLPGLGPAWQPGRTLRDGLLLGHSHGYFRHSSDPDLDRLHDSDPAAWLEGYTKLYHRPFAEWQRQNPDGRWFQAFNKRTPDGTFIGVRLDITALKEREKALRESTARAEVFGHVLDAVPVAVYTKAPDLSLEYVNKAWCALTGIAREDAVGRRESELFPDGSGEHYERNDLTVLQSGAVLNVEEEVARADGSRSQLMTCISRLRDGDGAMHLVGSCTDITEIKAREAQLGETLRENAVLGHVLDGLPVGAFVKGEDFRIEYVNRAWTAMCGVSREEAIGRTDPEIFGQEDAANYRSCDAMVLATGEVLETQESLTQRSGARIQLMTRKSRLTGAGGQLHLVGSCIDITEIKAREAQLQETLRENEVFQNLIDNVPVSIYAKRADLRLIYVNKGWCEITGRTREDAIGKTDVELFGAQGEAFKEGDLAVLRTGRDHQIEEKAVEPSGRVRHQVARKSLLTASDGSLFLIGSTSDITELKEREEELKEAQRRAVVADRAKSEFLANMSHEIRTPMNGVLGMAELLARSDLDAKQKTFVDIIMKSGTALLTIINDILDFSKIDAGQMMLDPAPFDLAEAIEDVATLVSTRAREKDLELVVRVDPALCSRYVGDVGRIRQIVTNLVGNAVKFTEAGHVLVDVSGERKRGDAGAEACLTVSVTDTGIGIPADKLDLVFEKFAQVDASSTRRHEGTGLGLAITSRLIGLMGGRVGVRSVEGRGSTFWFTLTLPEAQGCEAAREPAADLSGARVLVVDDNAVNRAILLEQMQAWGFDACAAESAAEGLGVLRAAARLGLAVDCAVLDYQMPGTNGGELARRIRATAEIAATPLVLLSSVDQTLSGASFREVAFDAQLIKPARSSVLFDALAKAVGRRRAETAPSGGPSMSLPAPREGSKAPRPNKPPLPGETTAAMRAPSHRIDILVAEDNEVNQLVFTQILADTPYAFQIVGDGRQACEAFAEMNPRMILMDVSMPEMNGLEATAAIRRAQAGGAWRVPIVGVTAHALKGDRERCLEAGMDDYLPKPISPRALLEKIERWMGDGAKARVAGAS